MACSICRSGEHNARGCPDRRAFGDKRRLKRPRPKRPRGRPREHRYPEAFAAAGISGEPPNEPLELIRWAQRVAAVALGETVQGRGSTKLNTEIRGMARTIAILTPKDVILEARRALQRDSIKSKQRRPDRPLDEPVGGSRPMR